MWIRSVLKQRLLSVSMPNVNAWKMSDVVKRKKMNAYVQKLKPQSYVNAKWKPHWL